MRYCKMLQKTPKNLLANPMFTEHVNCNCLCKLLIFALIIETNFAILLLHTPSYPLSLLHACAPVLLARSQIFIAFPMMIHRTVLSIRNITQAPFLF